MYDQKSWFLGPNAGGWPDLQPPAGGLSLAADGRAAGDDGRAEAARSLGDFGEAQKR